MSQDFVEVTQELSRLQNIPTFNTDAVQDLRNNQQNADRNIQTIQQEMQTIRQEMRTMQENILKMQQDMLKIQQDTQSFSPLIQIVYVFLKKNYVVLLKL